MSEKDYFAGLTVCHHCGGSTEEPEPDGVRIPSGRVSDIPTNCTVCGGTGALGPKGEPAADL